MLFAASALKGYAIDATDGRLGTVDDLLFDDQSWKLRWIVVETGSWLSKRKVLVHPSSITQAHHVRQELTVRLSKAQVEASPDISRDAPVSRQMESSLYSYYDWDPYWQPGYFGGGALSTPLSPYPYPADRALREDIGMAGLLDDGDPHLRSVAAVTGYNIHASDGIIGHVEGFLVDDSVWDIRYLIVDTRNWWPGKHVLLSPYAVREIDWSGHAFHLDVTRARVKDGPDWDPAAMIDEAYEKQLHTHYGWRGYGWPGYDI